MQNDEQPSTTRTGRNFGKLMKDARERRRWTQRELSERLAEATAPFSVKLDTSAITRMEKGQREPRLREAIEISELLEFSLDLVGAADLDEIGGEAQFARGEVLVRREMEAARRKILDACFQFHVAFDGMFSDAEELAILSRRGVLNADEWMTKLCQEMSFAFDRQDEYGRTNFYVVGDETEKRIVSKMVETIINGLFKTEDEVLETADSDFREYRLRLIQLAKDNLVDALGDVGFAAQFGEVFANVDVDKT